MPRPLLRLPALRRLETAAASSLPPHALMERAAHSAAELVARRWPGRRVIVLCGPGNNGGDGALMAALLHEQGFDVQVWALPVRKPRPPDAQAIWKRVPDALFQHGAPTDLQIPVDRPGTLIVDAMFGIGLTRELDAVTQGWIAWANAQPCDVLALDVPSGLDADTGAAQASTTQACCTLTFLADKPGLHTRAGTDYAGEVIVADLDTGHPLDAGIDRGDTGLLITRKQTDALFTSRLHDTHKGSFGTVALLAGAAGMTGAGLLAGRAALLAGAGKVFVALAQEPHPLPCDMHHPELMLRGPDAMIEQAEQLGVTTWVGGCGLGTSPTVRAWFAKLLDTQPSLPLVLDADALTMVGTDVDLARRLAARSGPRVLTPHPREAAGMLGVDTTAIQADRIDAARKISQRYDAWTVLKGAGTVVSSPKGEWTINASGNPGLATAGTGDVLAGMLGALIAQGLEVEDAVRGGVWLHGAAADRLVALGHGPIGLTASEVADAVRWLRNHPPPR